VTSTGANELRDHWWWRPGWREGRHFYACHIVFPNHEDLAQLVAAYQEPLRELPGLDLIPQRWLHLTMQGIGFVDQVGEVGRAAVLDALTRGLRDAVVPKVTFARPTVVREAIYLLAEPPDELQQLRMAAREAISEALGADRIPDALEHSQDYHPHVSVAYSSATQPSGPILEALATVQPTPVTVRLDTVYLLEFHRDHRMYEWTSATPIRVGSQGE
jgi:2'-5' RNA ligase